MSDMSKSAAGQGGQQLPEGGKAPKAARARRGDATDGSRDVEKGSWRVSPEARRRLAIHAIMAGESQSEYLDKMLRALNHYTMPGANTRGSKRTQPTCDTGEDRQEATAA